MVGPTERFYAKSHQFHQSHQVPGAPDKTPDQILEEVTARRHRYYCVSEHLMANRDLSVVELGFGSAAVPLALSRFVAHYKIVDIVPRHEGASFSDKVSFTKADLNEDFPFADGEFDCTIAMMLVEHLFDPFHSFREIARITKRGGKIFVNLPNIASIRCRLQLAVGKMPVTSSADWFEKEEWDGNHLHYFTIRDTQRLAEHVGLKLDAYFPVGNQLWLKCIAPSLFCHEVSFAFSKP